MNQQSALMEAPERTDATPAPVARMPAWRGVHRWFTDQAGRAPRSTALVYRDQAWTYADVESRSNRIAQVLRRCGVVKGSVVGVCLEPSPDVPITILAIWKLGGVYLPLEPSHPLARLDELLKDSACTAVVLSGMFYEVARNMANFLYLDAPDIDIDAAPDELPVCEIEPEALAYLMYTSGSTGRPKGVMVSHGALASKLGCAGTWGVVEARCRAAWLSSVAFDASLAQMFLPLAHGGRVVVVEAFERLDPRRVWALLHAAEVNVLDCTPSWLLAMLDAPPPPLALERIVLGGETLTPSLARRVREAFPSAVLVNIYGPTEACIDAAAHTLREADFSADIVPIGKPLPHYALAVLDDRMSPVADGATGELYIAGPGLARGYWNLPQATQERFRAHPSAPQGRWYRSGDLARRRGDGAFEFLGRADHQIKIRGQRIELGEIEFTLSRHADVEAAVVKAWPTADGSARLVAYVVWQSGRTGADRLRDDLLSLLPRHMVPDDFVEMQALPLLASGKVNRGALEEPQRTERELGVADLPRTELERDLVRLWAQVLGVERIGIHDNFFELGGHSLTAVKLVERINAHCRADLTLSLLLSQANVADLALALVRGQTALQAARVLHFSKKSDTRTPLFLLPPVTGVGMVYAGLAREIARVAPSVALQAVGWDDAAVGTATMPELAAAFIDEVMRIQPQGPWRFCGYSAGGTVGHEMVRQMQGAGRRVSHLFLIDPYCHHAADDPTQPAPESAEDDLWAVCRDMVWDTMGLRGAAADAIVALARRLCDDPSLVSTDEAAAILPRTMDLRMFRLLLDGLRNSWFAYSAHRVAPLPDFDGQAWLIQPDADPDEFRAQRVCTWRRLIGDAVQPVVIAGEHSSMLNRWHTVQAIGLCVREHL